MIPDPRKPNLNSYLFPHPDAPPPEVDLGYTENTGQATSPSDTSARGAFGSNHKDFLGVGSGDRPLTPPYFQAKINPSPASSESVLPEPTAELATEPALPPEAASPADPSREPTQPPSPDTASVPRAIGDTGLAPIFSAHPHGHTQPTTADNLPADTAPDDTEPQSPEPPPAPEVEGTEPVQGSSPSAPLPRQPTGASGGPPVPPNSPRGSSASAEEPDGKGAGGFGVARFNGYVPTPREIGQVRERHIGAIASALSKHADYIDVRTSVGGYSRGFVLLEHRAPNGWVKLQPYGEYTRGPYTVGLFTVFNNAEGTPEDYHYYDVPTEERIYRDDVVEREVGSAIPKPGSIPDKLREELRRERVAEADASMLKLHEELGIGYHLVGLEETEYVHRMLASAEPHRVPLVTLDRMVLRAIASPLSPEPADTALAASDFARYVRAYMKSQGFEPGTFATSIKTDVIDPRRGELMQIRAGEGRDDMSGGLIPFVQVRYRDDLEQQAREESFPDRLIQMTAGLDRVQSQVDFGFRIMGNEFVGTRLATLRDTDGRLIYADRPQLFRADSLLARGVRNFLRKPMVNYQ